MKNKIILSIIMFILGLLMGWVFPVEGPIDYVYDEWAENQTLKKPPSINVAKPQDVKTVEIDPNELSEEDFEVLYFVPLKKNEE